MRRVLPILLVGIPLYVFAGATAPKGGAAPASAASGFASSNATPVTAAATPLRPASTPADAGFAQSGSGEFGPTVPAPVNPYGKIKVSAIRGSNGFSLNLMAGYDSAFTRDARRAANRKAQQS